jgi:hypothetical protein
MAKTEDSDKIKSDHYWLQPSFLQRNKGTVCSLFV